MAFDGIVTRAMSRELAQKLEGSRIDKIHQPDKLEMVFTIRTRSSQEKLFISISAGRAELHLASDESFDNPKTPPAFCMLMRKHLSGAFIDKIEQVDWERIIRVSLTIKDEMGYPQQVYLYVELMGRYSNLILVSGQGKILAAMKNVSEDQSRVRPISLGQDYVLPPAQDKVFPEGASQSFLEPLKTYKDVLSNIQGISPIIAEEIVESPSRRAYIDRLLAAIQDPQPSVYIREDDRLADFHVKRLEYHDGFKRKDFDTISQAVSYFFEGRISSNRMRQKTAVLDGFLTDSLKKLHLKLQKLHEDLEAADRADKYQLYGELLTANLHLLKAGMDSVQVTNYYDGQEIKIPLDPMLQPNQNAQRYFKKYSKAKRAKIEKQEQIDLAKEEIEYLTSVASFLRNAETVEEVDAIKAELSQGGYLRNKQKINKQKKKNESRSKFKPKEYVTSGGFRLLVGRNNKENDQLTMKKASKKDLWFHTKDIPGSHVIMFTEGQEPQAQDIYQAAAIAAYHSAGKESENVPVDMVQVKYVKKPNGAKPGMVIFKNNQTFYVTPKLPE